MNSLANFDFAKSGYLDSFSKSCLTSNISINKSSLFDFIELPKSPNLSVMFLKYSLSAFNKSLKEKCCPASTSMFTLTISWAAAAEDAKKLNASCDSPANLVANVAAFCLSIEVSPIEPSSLFLIP